MQRRGVIAACILSALLFAAGTAALAESASAAWHPVPENGMPGNLVLVTEAPIDRVIRVESDRPTFWRVSARLEDQDEGELTLGIVKTGMLSTHREGLRVSVETCAEEWSTSAVSPTCAAGGVPVLAVTPADDATAGDSVWDLGRLDPTDPVHLLVTLQLADELTDPALDTARGSLSLRLAASSTPDPEAELTRGPVAASGSALSGSGGLLATTGVDAIAFAIAALGLIGIGVFGARLRRGAAR